MTSIKDCRINSSIRFLFAGKPFDAMAPETIHGVGEEDETFEERECDDGPTDVELEMALRSPTAWFASDREMHEGALRLRAPIMLRGPLNRPGTACLDRRLVNVDLCNLRRRSQRHLKRGAARGQKQAIPGSLAVAAHIALTGDRGIDRLPLAIMSEFHTGRDRQHLGETASGAIDAAFHGPDRGAANPRRLFVG